MVASVIEAYSGLEAEVQIIRTRLAVVDSMLVGRSNNLRGVAHEAVSAAVVRAAGLLEVYFSNVAGDVETQVNQSATPVHNLQPGLRAVLSRGCTRWPTRPGGDLGRVYRSLEVADPTEPRASALIVTGILLPQGRTIRAEVVSLLWRLLALPGPPFLSVQEQVALNRLADYRNWIAHGEETADGLAGILMRSGVDLHKLLGGVLETCERVAVSVDDYCAKAGWRL